MAQNSSHLPGAGVQFAQSLNVLNWFRSHPNGTFMQASSQLGLSVPQIKHELRQLSFCGLPGYLPGSLVEVNVGKTTASVEFTAGLDKPLALTSMEAGVLLFNLEALRSTVEASSHEAIDEVSAKIRALLRDSREGSAANRGTSSVEGQVSRAPAAPNLEKKLTAPGTADTAKSIDAQALDQANAEVQDQVALLARLRTAVNERRLVSADYHSLRSDSVTRRTWIPDHIALINGDPYLWGREVEREQRTYAIERMSKVHIGAENSAPAALTPEVDGEDPFNFHASSVWATLKLRDSLAWMLEYYPMWIVEDEAEKGTLTVTMPYTGPWLERFCVAYGQDIEVLEPLELAQNITQRAQAGIQAYSDGV